MPSVKGKLRSEGDKIPKPAGVASAVCSRGHTFYKSRKRPVCPKCWPGYYKKKLKK